MRELLDMILVCALFACFAFQWINDNKIEVDKNWWFSRWHVKYIFVRENDQILFQISQNFVLKIATDDKAAFVQVMAWCQIGDRPLSEPTRT